MSTVQPTPPTGLQQDTLAAGEKLKKSHLRLSGDSIFYTIQGEGPTVGYPALFLRLHECNLKCTWCDAWYTWDRSRPEYWTEATEMTIERVAIEMEAWSLRTGCYRWVITGGEPLMQREQLSTLIHQLKEAADQNSDRYVFEIETNGTIVPTQYLGANCRFNVSPKLSSSGNEPHRTYNPKAMQVLARTTFAIFKFVVVEPRDLAEIRSIIGDFVLPGTAVYLMPEGTTPEALRKHGRLCAEWAKRYGWRVSPRLQIDLFGDTRRT